MVHDLKKSKAGFTLVELIVVIAILGILAGIAVPVYSGYLGKAGEAADLQLLGALNTAYHAACAEMGVDPTAVTANVSLSGSTGAKTVDAVTASYAAGSAGSGSVEGINASFFRYFAGNEDKEFKQIEVLYYNRPDGIFVGYTAGETIMYSTTIGGKEVSLAIKADDLSNYFDSTFSSIGTADLTSSINSLSKNAVQANADWFDQDAEFIEFLSGLELTVADLTPQQKANALVLYAASGAKGINTTDYIRQLTENGSISISGGGAEEVASASAMYALMTAYKNSELAKSNPIVVEDQTIQNKANFATNKAKYAELVAKYGAENVSATKADGTAWNGTTGYGGLNNVTFTIKGSETSVEDFFKDSTEELGGLTDVATMYSKLYATDGFKTYLSTQGKTDLDGFISTMNIINDNVSKLGDDGVASVLANGYTDESLVAMLQSILGS